MLTTQARLAMKNDEPVRLAGDLYHVLRIKRTHGDKIVAFIKKLAPTNVTIRKLKSTLIIWR